MTGSRLLAPLAAAIALACSTSALAQAAATTPTPAPAYTPTSLAVARDVPRTRDGKPDLQNVVWDAPFLAPLGTITSVSPNLVIPESEAAAAFTRVTSSFINNPAFTIDPEAPNLILESRGLPIVRGERRTRLIVQPATGILPITPQATRAATGALTAMLTQKADNPEDRILMERCLALGGQPPIATPSTLHPRLFVITRTHVVVQTEYGDEVRIIPFAQTHGPAVLAGINGDSIARWDGDTLVIETTHNPAAARVRPLIPLAFMVINPEAKVIERYTRITRDELLYQFTVEDPAAYSQPWMAEYSLMRADFRMYPGGCHEHNYGLENILSGQRETDKLQVARLADLGIVETTTEPAARWTASLTTAAEVRWWAVLASKDAAGSAQVALRIERLAATAGPNGMSELNVFEVDCAGQRLRRTSAAAFGARNLTGDKRELPVQDWAPVTQRPMIAEGVRQACV